MGYYNRQLPDVATVWYTLYKDRKNVITSYFDDMIKSKAPSAIKVHKKSNSITINPDYYGEITA